MCRETDGEEGVWGGYGGGGVQKEGDHFVVRRTYENCLSVSNKAVKTSAIPHDGRKRAIKLKQEYKTFYFGDTDYNSV